MVGVRGFEPPASASRTQRSSQTEPHGAAEPERSEGTHPQRMTCLSRCRMVESNHLFFESKKQIPQK